VATSSEAHQLFPHDYSTVFDGTVAALQTSGFSIKVADPTNGTIIASSSMDLMSWGEDLQLRLWQEHDGQSAVQVASSSKFGLVDWGKNKKNVDKLFAAIHAHVSNPSLGMEAPHQAQSAAPAAAWHADPTTRHEHRYWDGTQRTDQVSDAGQVSSDPVSSG
jgi:uncharacterized protein (DUF1499 family)